MEFLHQIYFGPIVFFLGFLGLFIGFLVLFLFKKNIK